MDGAIDMGEGMTLAAFEALAATAPFDARWELVAGRLVRGRYGEPWEHATIIRNIAAKLGNDLELRGQSYQTFTETFYVKSRPLGMAMLPDVLVVGGGLTPGATSIDNPIVLFEILSPDTEARDRSEKWRAYRQLPALRHYVLVARDDARLEVYDRADGVWSASRVITGLDATLDLFAIRATLPLRAIYGRVLSA